MRSYRITRTNGVVQSADGDDGWEEILKHEDVTEPGRISSLEVFGTQHPGPLVVTLEAIDTLFLKRRARLIAFAGGGSELLGTRYIVGKRFPNGSGSYFGIYADGSVLWSPTHLTL